MEDKTLEELMQTFAGRDFLRLLVKYRKTLTTGLQCLAYHEHNLFKGNEFAEILRDIEEAGMSCGLPFRPEDR